MRDVFFLKCDRYRVLGMTKKPPRVVPGEYAVRVVIELPDRIVTEAMLGDIPSFVIEDFSPC